MRLVVFFSPKIAKVATKKFHLQAAKLLATACQGDEKVIENRLLEVQTKWLSGLGRLDEDAMKILHSTLTWG